MCWETFFFGRTSRAACLACDVVLALPETDLEFGL